MTEARERILAHLARKRDTALGVASALGLPKDTARKALKQLLQDDLVTSVTVGFLHVYQKNTLEKFTVSDLPEAKRLLAILTELDSTEQKWVKYTELVRAFTKSRSSKAPKNLEHLIQELSHVGYLETNNYARIRITLKGEAWLRH